LEGELPVQLGEADDMIGFFIVEAVFHHELLEFCHFVVDLHREGAVEIHDLLDEIE